VGQSAQRKDEEEEGGNGLREYCPIGC